MKRNCDPDYPYSHLLFADDLLIFCRANKRSLQAVSNLLKILKLNTGLDINKSKSMLYFSKGVRNKETLSSICGIPFSSLPAKYLGLPLSIQYLKTRHYSSLIDGIRRRLEGWMSRSLSIGGRAELIKTVIYGMIYYWILSFKMPQKVQKLITSLCIRFMWKNKVHAWGWDQICRPKKEGGLGIRNFNDLNRATSLKLLWNCINSKGLLGKWLNEVYLKGNVIWTIQPALQDSGTWKHLCSNLELGKSCIRYSETSNTWIWEQTSNGLFSYKSAWKVSRKWYPLLPCYKTVWPQTHCPKMSICLLRAMLHKLPTKDKLNQLGIVYDDRCVLCNNNLESVQHLFFQCSFTSRIWKICSMKLGLHHQIQSLPSELLIIHNSFKEKTKITAFAKLVFSATIWHL